MTTFISGLIVGMCLGLGYFIWRENISKKTSENFLREEVQRLWAGQKIQQHKIYQFSVAMAYVGEMIDHMGVSIEDTDHGAELKAIGAIIRETSGPNPYRELSYFDSQIESFANKYGIKKNPTDAVEHYHLVKVANVILDRCEYNLGIIK